MSSTTFPPPPELCSEVRLARCLRAPSVVWRRVITWHARTFRLGRPFSRVAFELGWSRLLGAADAHTSSPCPQSSRRDDAELSLGQGPAGTCPPWIGTRVWPHFSNVAASSETKKKKTRKKNVKTREGRYRLGDFVSGEMPLGFSSV